jgi:hypothetical protein
MISGVSMAETQRHLASLHLVVAQEAAGQLVLNLA